MLDFRRATRFDLDAIAQIMREDDVTECRACGHSPREALEAGFSGGGHTWTVSDASGPFLAFGVTPMSLMDRIGRPWLLSSPRLWNHRKALLRLSGGMMWAIEERYPRLENYVWAGNDKSIRLLGKLGFAVEAELHEIGGLPFHHFSKGF